MLAGAILASRRAFWRHWRKWEFEQRWLCRQVENEFVGVQCGIMDQFISALGRCRHALFLDCRTLTYEQVPLPDSVKIVVCNTGVKRELASSEYNQRRYEWYKGPYKCA